jgi:hypothetical protein
LQPRRGPGNVRSSDGDHAEPTGTTDMEYQPNTPAKRLQQPAGGVSRLPGADAAPTAEPRRSGQKQPPATTDRVREIDAWIRSEIRGGMAGSLGGQFKAMRRKGQRSKGEF